MTILRWILVFTLVAALLLVYVTVADHAPWPIYGAVGFVWGAGLVAVAAIYFLRIRRGLDSTSVKVGIAIAIAAYFLVIVLNQLVNSNFLHTNHKLLAFVAAFYAFVLWITALKFHKHRRTPTH